MNDATITQLGLTVLYVAAAALMALLGRIEASHLFRTWTVAFLLFGLDAGISAAKHAWKLPPLVHALTFVCLAGGAFSALRGGLEALGKRLPVALYWVGAALALGVVVSVELGVPQSIIEPVVFLVIALALASGSIAAFRAGVPGGAGRWVLSTGALAGSLYAALWTLRDRLPILARAEYQLDLTVLLWGSTGVLVMHFERNRERIKQLAAQEIELREQLAQSERLESLGRLAAGVAHDFNNVLAVVVNGSEVVLRQLGDRPKPAAQLRMVLDAAREATGFTRQLLALGRRDLPEKSRQNLHDAIQAAVRIFQPALPPGVALEYRHVARHITVLAAEGQLEQLVVNLALNAADAMPGGGSLRIEVNESAPSPGEVRLTVTDSGAGMDEATRARIFEPFFTTKTSSRGTGLGLTAVHTIVAALGGRIAVETNPGQGTSFTIDLPTCPASPHQATSEAPDAPTRSSSGAPPSSGVAHPEPSAAPSRRAGATH